ncbi:MAG TPA: substrate-binding domain-containing protein, partial [Bacilli bacterium]
NPALILTDFTVDYQDIQEDHPLFRYIKNRMATAYITSNGKLGLLVFRIAQKLGLRIPGDISIVTFDDPAAEYDASMFTHISQSEDQMGREAARMLIEVVESGNRVGIKYRKVVLTPEMIVRQTTGRVSPQ